MPYFSAAGVTPRHTHRDCVDLLNMLVQTQIRMSETTSVMSLILNTLFVMQKYDMLVSSKIILPQTSCSLSSYLCLDLKQNQTAVLISV